MTGTLGATALFLAFVAVMFAVVYRQLRRESQTDAPV
jgi:hypothetical protein